MPKASFVIPVYNGQAYIAEAIESCLNQTVKAIEVVVVDDGSTDSTASILAHYKAKDKRVEVVSFTENQGRSHARNVGVHAAKSDIILTLDADDIALPNRVDTTLRYFKKNPGVDLFYGRFHVIDEMGGVQGAIDADAFNWEKLKETKFTFICHSTMAFRKSVFEKVQYQNGEFASLGIEDWRFQVDAHKEGFRFGSSRKALSQYRFIHKTRDEKRILELKNQCLA
jgi:glycosyltransferase involved in cell wall biosynthesis